MSEQNKAGRPVGADKIRKERRIHAVMLVIPKWKPNTIVKHFSAKWGITPRNVKRYIKTAQKRLIEIYNRDFALDKATELAALDSVVQTAFADLNALDKTTRQVKKIIIGAGETAVSETGLAVPGQQMIESSEITNEVVKKKQKGRVGIYQALIKALEQRARLKGLHNPELFASLDQGFDIMELAIGEDTESKENGGESTTDNSDAENPQA